MKQTLLFLLGCLFFGSSSLFFSTIVFPFDQGKKDDQGQNGKAPAKGEDRNEIPTVDGLPKAKHS